jgi:hypothetical protein
MRNKRKMLSKGCKSVVKRETKGRQRRRRIERRR